MSKFVVVQVALRKWIVAQSTGGGPYRRLCECFTEHAAGVVKAAMEKAQ